MSKSWYEGLLTPNIGYAIGFLGVFYSTRAGKSNELRKIRHAAFLEFSSKLSKGARIAEQVGYAKSSTYETDEEKEDAIDKLVDQFSDWISDMDIAQIAFELSAPNYVSNVGDDFYDVIRSFYDGEVRWRHYQHLWVKFQAVAKFDLRHFVWSYLRSVVFLINSAVNRVIKVVWHLVPRRRKIRKWFLSLEGVRWVQNWRNASYEMNLIEVYGLGPELA